MARVGTQSTHGVVEQGNVAKSSGAWDVWGVKINVSAPEINAFLL